MKLKLSSKQGFTLPAVMAALGKPWLALCVSAVVAALLLPATASAAVGPAVQLLWSVQPGSAGVGVPFSQQPTLVTADANGNPSTVGLASSLLVTVDTIPAGGLNGGARTVDIGTGGNNGVIAFSGLQIDSAGGYSLSATSGNGTNGVFSPTNGISNCQVWLDASDVNTLTVGSVSNLQIWSDKSGAGNNATNINVDGVSNTPLTNSNPDLAPFAYGGQRVVSFYGTNRLNVNLNSITNSTYTIVAITELALGATANNDYYIGTPFLQVGSDGGVDHALHIGYRNSSTYSFAQYADDLDVPTVTGAVIASHVHSVGQKQTYLNGALAGTQTGAQNLLVISQANIGQGNGGNFHGDIAEIVVYNTNLTEVQRVGVENYLANKWLGQLSSAATSGAFFVGNGQTVAGLGFSQQPTVTTAGVAISPSVAVTVTNSSGVGISGLQVFVSLVSGPGGLGGTLSQITDANGVATFGDLNLLVAGQYKLQAAIPGAVTNSSVTFNVAAGQPSQLVLKTQPSAGAAAGAPFATQPVVAVEDVYSNVVLTATDAITASETAGGNLSATAANSVQVTAVAGLATFSGLYLTNTGTQTITFTDSALTVNSANINVVPGAIINAGLSILVQPPSTAQVGVAFETQPVIALFDSFGNPATNGTPVVATASLGGLLGQKTAFTANGTATFVGLASTNLGNVTLTFTSGVASIDSTAITVTVGPVSTVVWTTQPGSALVGSPFGQQPVLKTADAGGNISQVGLDENDWVVVHLVSGSGLVGDSFTYNIGTSGSNGAITFHGLEIDAPGNNNVLSADYLGATPNPTNNIANCILWLDAYDTSSLAVTSNGVVQWTDKSGTLNNATNTANFPYTNINTSLPVAGYGGQHVVSFLGTNFLNVNLTPIVNTYYTIFAVDVVNPITANDYFIGSAFSGVDGTLGIGYRNPNTFTIQQYADDINYTAPGNFTTATPRLWTARLNTDNSSQEIFLNGNNVATRSVNNFLVTLTNGTIGGAGGSGYGGDLAEVLVYNRSLSDTERQTVEQYLTHKWMSNSRSLTTPFSVVGLNPILKITPGANNALQLMLTGIPGQTYRIFTSPSLALPFSSWTPLGTNTLTVSGAWQLNDTNNQGVRFYRAVTP